MDASQVRRLLRQLREESRPICRGQGTVTDRASTALMQPLARIGETCSRVAPAGRVAVLFDAEEYFGALHAALLKAQRSILLLGWDFDPRTDLDPSRDGNEPGSEVGALLQHLVASRPQLRAHILIWDMVLPISMLHFGYPQRSREWFADRIEFELDARHPPGACHHQKIVVIDDAIAFCGGTDLASDRWDSVAHHDNDPRRRLPSGRSLPPRHDLMMMVDGPAAVALGDLARARWQRATGTQLASVQSRATSDVSQDLWPEGRAPDLTDVDVAIAVTQPAFDNIAEATENLRLHVESIAAARELIYLENQYIVAPEIGRALAARLAEADGPEIILVCGSQSPSYFDRLAIDGAQHALLSSLRTADRFGRLRACTPVTGGGTPIIVHSKASIIDDRLLRIGSTNLNNRSLGFDTECDLAIDASAQGTGGARVRQSIANVRDGLLAHHLDVNPAVFRDAVARGKSFVATIDALRPARLQPAHAISAPVESPIRSLIAEYHLGDPRSVEDAWRPWKRPG
jgi:phosphatidylserine/phosphatidylglycerophosphate/cardiolipin synthase-like enzyme